MIKKIHCVYILVNDLDESTDFYENILGLKLRLKEKNWAEFELNNCIFALHEKKSIEKVKPSFLNIVFEVKNLKKEFIELKSKGVNFFEEPKKQSFGQTLIIEDPNGHKIELVQPLTEEEKLKEILR